FKNRDIIEFCGSKGIKRDDMNRNLEAKKKFLMYPRRVLHFSGHVTPLFPTILVPASVEEGEGLGTHTEPQPTPSPTQPSVGDQTHVTESSSRLENTQNSRNTLEGTGGSEGDQVQVLALETSKDAQAAKILKLNTSIKKLEKKYDSAFDNLDADLAYGMDYMDTEEAVNEGRKRVSIVVLEVSNVNISTASRPEVSTATPMTPPTTTSEFDNEDITLAKTLVKMKDDKAKLKGMAIKEVEESYRPARLVLTLNPLQKIDPKDKGKGVIKEEPKPTKKLKKSDLDAAQLAMDEEVVRQVNAKLKAELERERVTAKEATQAVLASEFDEIQAKMNAYTLLAERLQEAEREQFTIEQRAKFLHDTIAPQRKFHAEQRAVAIRSKTLTKTQLRNQMITFLKYVGRYTHNELINKKFEEVQVLYEKSKKSIQDFVPIGSPEDERLIEKINKKAAGEDTSKKEKVLEEPDSTKMEVKQEEVEESIRKRPGSPIMKRMSKTKKTDSDLEKEEHLKTFLKIVPDEEGIGIYYMIFRSDGSSRWIKKNSEMLTRFDRLDLVELYNLVMQRFETTTLEGVDLVLWGDLRTIEEVSTHKETLKKMMSLKLVAESTSDGAYNLLRSIQKQLMNLEALMEVRRIFKCWFYNHTTNGHQFTMSNRHQELASLEQTTTGKETSNPFMAVSTASTSVSTGSRVSTVSSKKYDNTLPLTKRRLVKYLRKMSNTLFTRISEDNWENHKEAVVNYADLKASINDYYDENIAHQD
ncbi:hypothetical protein Tco_0145875, partial [Tanacetum coccineum]